MSSTNTAAPCLCNFFIDGKGPKGLTDPCKNQAMYDGAVGARGIHTLRSHVDSKTAYDKRAYTTYHGGSGDLKIYTTHPTLSNVPQDPVHYHMTQLNGWNMTGNPEFFQREASAFRNARVCSCCE